LRDKNGFYLTRHQNPRSRNELRIRPPPH
jgi:hypothetical protein